MQKQPSKICILADSHNLLDDRIYWKEALSLKYAGYDLVFILADENDESGQTPEGIRFIKIKRDRIASARILNYFSKRFSKKGLYHRMFQLAKNENADFYHYHDLRIGQLARRLKKLPQQPKIIYDVHEPYPENIADYHSGGKFRSFLKTTYSAYIRKWERKNAANCDLIITTEENLQQRFKKYFPQKKVEIIYNYTNLPEAGAGRDEKKYDAIYTGGITKCRGAMKILEAVHLARKRLPDIRILFLGSWFPPELKAKMQQFINDHQLGENVEMKNAVPYARVENYYRKSKIGLGIFLPIPTHRIILQIKIFEYMNFGLPIVGSNFGHIHDIIQKHQCGLSVDPEKPDEIAQAMIQLLTDNELYEKLSSNGKQAVKENYRWTRMGKKLIEVYQAME